MNEERPIVCLGIMVADVIGRPVRELPDAGRLVLVDEMSLHTGGCAINTATALARLGIPVEVIGKVGADPFGDFLLYTLDERGRRMPPALCWIAGWVPSACRWALMGAW